MGFYLLTNPQKVVAVYIQLANIDKKSKLYSVVHKKWNRISLKICGVFCILMAVVFIVAVVKSNMKVF